MPLYNEIGFYRAITEAETAGQCALHLKRFVTVVLKRSKLPAEVRGLFVEEAYELFHKLWGEEVPDTLAHALSTFYMQDDTTGGLSGDNKYAKCSSFEYSFYSYRKEKRIATEDYFLESEFSPMIENSKVYGDYMVDQDYWIWLEEVIDRSNLRPDEEYVFRKNVLEGISLRKLEGYNGLSKSTLGRRLKDARKKFTKAVKKYGKEAG